MTTIPSKDDTPSYCTRVNKEEMNVNSKIESQKGLIEIGKLMESSNQDKIQTTNKFPKLKTMSIEELYDYVEKRLSKEQYSPEVIFLLFQIQSLVLERENMKSVLIDNHSTIKELKKDLVSEKVFSSDIKETLKETTNELDDTEKENKKEMDGYKDKFRLLEIDHTQTLKRKNVYEKILVYIAPLTILTTFMSVNYTINTVKSLFV